MLLVYLKSWTKLSLRMRRKSKLVGMHEAFEKNFDWIVPENPFDENSEPRSIERGSSEPYIDKIQYIVEKVSVIDLNAPSLENT